MINLRRCLNLFFLAIIFSTSGTAFSKSEIDPYTEFFNAYHTEKSLDELSRLSAKFVITNIFEKDEPAGTYSYQLPTLKEYFRTYIYAEKYKLKNIEALKEAFNEEEMKNVLEVYKSEDCESIYVSGVSRYFVPKKEFLENTNDRARKCFEIVFPGYPENRDSERTKKISKLNKHSKRLVSSLADEFDEELQQWFVRSAYINQLLSIERKTVEDSIWKGLIRPKGIGVYATFDSLKYEYTYQLKVADEVNLPWNAKDKFINEICSSSGAKNAMKNGAKLDFEWFDLNEKSIARLVLVISDCDDVKHSA
ncbi:hypothetical protein [Veronia pacifica]|uniref:Uncharacterized protein n=1 Tax=Veronia pacifica TaxID=1080227 RepID=A0A1C3ELC0_9GAMM|nr:hypothetical protein [Veronia pacifica]ODA34024.1 hypothetical protein A8L45_08235 [Veronia pacifica]